MPDGRSRPRGLSEWTLFHVRGIAVRAHISLILFLPFLAWLIAVRIPALGALPLVPAEGDAVAAALGGYGAWVAGAAVAVGLFASVLLHELGHAILAQNRGVPVPAITLWIFGGMSHLEAERPPKPGTEALFSAAGPAVSFVLGIIGAIATPFIPIPWAAFVVGYLAFLNIVLGVFNLLPAFPLDGGRIFRAALAARMPYTRATRIAATVGKGFAVLLGIAGLFVNIFLIFIALFVYAAASQEANQVELMSALEPVPVAAVMDRAPAVVEPEVHLDSLVDRMLANATNGFPVVRNGGVVGVVTLTDVRAVPAEARPVTRVEEVMSRDLATATRRDSANDALERMLRRKVGRLLVLDERGNLEGVVTREGILRAFEMVRAGDVDTDHFGGARPG